MNLIQVTREFATEDQCLDYLEHSRWPEGVRCPVCGNDKISRITRESKTKNKRTRQFACLEPTCKHRFSPTVGTIFHGSHIPLRTWFMAITIVMDAKKGMSANQLKEHLGIGSYRTAWYMVHRIRKAMVDEFPAKLSGIVEVDETYIGGKSKRRGVGRPPRPKKDMVIGMRERGGRVRFFHVPDVKKDTVKGLLDRHISSNTRRIMTDAAVVYPFAMDKDFKPKHRSVNHSIEWVKPGDISVHTNTIESAFSLLKRGLIGSFHHVTIKHLHRYLAEFETRFNMREDAHRFENIVRRMLTTDTMEYKQLTANPTEA
jgi:ISXO2-like transposase domain/Transposase zinc-ribbon domain